MRLTITLIHLDDAHKNRGYGMKDKYDFSQGQRGKFYSKEAVFKEPVYLDDEIQKYLATRADSKGIELSELVNFLLRKDIELIEAARE